MVRILADKGAAIFCKNEKGIHLERGGLIGDMAVEKSSKTETEMKQK